MTSTTNRLSPQDIEAFEPDAKIGLLATSNPDRLPHVTLITTLRAKSPTQLHWGQFCEGKSKEHVRSNPNTAFLVMNTAREVWRGKARWTHEVGEGEDYERFNKSPMFRYNAYFGIHTVHYMDLVTTTAKRTLFLPGITAGYGITAAARYLTRRRDGRPALKPWAISTVDKIQTLKFVSWIGQGGFPEIVPVVPCQTAGPDRLVLAPTVYRRELLGLQPGQPVAVFALTMEMESVLVRGTFGGYRGHLGVKFGTLDIDWVYNSMPPVPGQVYPVVPLRPVDLVV
ncbi:MAG: hypothetical protein JW797_03870 [Bradymonadales bacterium]|nr:hypothetical protein [Bradymonadales bacterium]